MFAEHLKQHQVASIILVHGTFAGNDALGLFELVKPINENLANTLKDHGKALLDVIANDVGNYTTDYARLLSKLCKVPCELFVWSSGNYHLARLYGALQLAELLAQRIQAQELQGLRLLLLGHSHAGQLFALLSRFLSNAEDLYAIMASDTELAVAKQNLQAQLQVIRTVQLDFVTLGTPIRYAWGKADNCRLLAIVNHRSDSTPSGIVHTRDGDYVQHWGIAGTDAYPPQHKALNDAFDRVLDDGRNRLLVSQLGSTRQINPAGDNLLLDYQDNATDGLDLSHCIKTLFGHGVYTRYKKMRFTMHTIVQHWY